MRNHLSARPQDGLSARPIHREQRTAGPNRQRLSKPPLPSPAAARYIGMSDSWLRQTRMEGRSDGPPFLRMGARTVRYLPTDLDKWLEERRRSAHMALAATGPEAPVPGA